MSILEVVELSATSIRDTPTLLPSAKTLTPSQSHWNKFVFPMVKEAPDEYLVLSITPDHGKTWQGKGSHTQCHNPLLEVGLQSQYLYPKLVTDCTCQLPTQATERHLLKVAVNDPMDVSRSVVSTSSLSNSSVPSPSAPPLRLKKQKTLTSSTSAHRLKKQEIPTAVRYAGEMRSSQAPNGQSLCDASPAESSFKSLSGIPTAREGGGLPLLYQMEVKSLNVSMSRRVQERSSSKIEANRMPAKKFAVKWSQLRALKKSVKCGRPKLQNKVGRRVSGGCSFAVLLLMLWILHTALGVPHPSPHPWTVFVSRFWESTWVFFTVL